MTKEGKKMEIEIKRLEDFVQEDQLHESGGGDDECQMCRKSLFVNEDQGL